MNAVLIDQLYHNIQKLEKHTTYAEIMDVLMRIYFSSISKLYIPSIPKRKSHQTDKYLKALWKYCSNDPTITRTNNYLIII